MNQADLELVKRELADDLGRGDLFSRLGEGEIIKAAMRAKQPGVFAAEPYVIAVCEQCGIDCQMHIKDGEKFSASSVLAVFSGPKSRVLIAERAALNFAQHASGIATKTAAMKALIAGYNTALLDTRKTRPGLRVLEKYAVRCGGGQNHRMGLDDVVMLKDTHLHSCTDWGTLVASLREKMPFYARIEIECDNFAEFERALDAGADAILLDAFTPQDCARAVQMRNERAMAAASAGTAPRYVLLEASGNIDESTIVAYAASGVDAISSGANIHQATWIDMSLRPLFD